MYALGVDLVKVDKALIRLARGALFWCICLKLPLSFFTGIKLLPHKSSEWSSLVPDPEAKSLEITTISYQYLAKDWTELVDHFGDSKIIILITLCLPTHEHGVSLHLISLLDCSFLMYKMHVIFVCWLYILVAFIGSSSFRFCVCVYVCYY